uniref:Uncharacterized protein n=1 Tax=Solanum tuberosum TaxID=4113 RepID=M1DGH3_SOLTU
MQVLAMTASHGLWMEPQTVCVVRGWPCLRWSIGSGPRPELRTVGQTTVCGSRIKVRLFDSQRQSTRTNGRFQVCEPQLVNLIESGFHVQGITEYHLIRRSGIKSSPCTLSLWEICIRIAILIRRITFFNRVRRTSLVETSAMHCQFG